MSHRSWYRSRKITPIANYMWIHLYFILLVSVRLTPNSIIIWSVKWAWTRYSATTQPNWLKATRIETVWIKSCLLFHFQVFHCINSQLSKRFVCRSLSTRIALAVIQCVYVVCVCVFFQCGFCLFANRIFLSSAIIDGKRERGVIDNSIPSN